MMYLTETDRNTIKITPNYVMIFDIATYVRQLLQNDPGLWELCVSSSEIGDDETVAIALALNRNAILQKLDLHYNYIGANGVAAVSLTLERHSRLEVLNLNWNQFDRVGAVAIASALKVNVSI